MIITRTPLRITFVGGGTDFPSFFETESGATLSATIDKYVYIWVNQGFIPGIRISYSSTENCKHVKEIKHPLFRESLKLVNIGKNLEKQIQLGSIADISSKIGIGLGSSSSFLVGLLNALFTFRGERKTQHELAYHAINIERNKLKELGGWQDQFIAAYGGFKFIEYFPKGIVRVQDITCSSTTLTELEKNIMLFYTGIDRSSDAVHRVNNIDSKQKLKQLRNIRDGAYTLREHLEKGNIDLIGKFLDMYWKAKQTFGSRITTEKINKAYEKAKNLGALGGKIIGAGGGGFLMLYAPIKKQDAICRALQELHFEYDPFQFEKDGSRLLFNDGRQSDRKWQYTT